MEEGASANRIVAGDRGEAVVVTSDRVRSPARMGANWRNETVRSWRKHGERNGRREVDNR